jgi:hypothetical protein
MTMSRQVNARYHFRLERPFTTSQLLTDYGQKRFRAKLEAVDGLSEEIEHSVPIIEHNHNMEAFTNVMIPRLLKAKRDFNWNWQVTWNKITQCMDNALMDRWDQVTRADYNTNALKTEANFKKCMAKTISAAINVTNPRDDIRTLIETTKKPQEMKPSELLTRFEELRQVQKLTVGQTSALTDTELYTALVRAMPQPLKDSLTIHRLEIGVDSIDDIIRHLDVAHNMWQRDHNRG